MWVVHINSEGICQYGQNNNVTIKCYYSNLLDASLATYFFRQNQQNRHCVKLNPLDSCLLLVYQMNHQTVTQTEFNFTTRQEKSSMTIKNKVQSYSDKLYLVGEHPEGEAAVGAGDALWDTPHGGPSVCTCLSPLTKRIFS